MNEQLEIAVVSNLTDKQIEQLVKLYHNEFWCSERERSDVDRMLENSDIVIGAENKSHDLVGFVRVLIDFIYKATIFDLIVHPKWRKHKIGKLLMDTIINHPELSDVEHIDLNCMPEMFKYYEQWAFTTDVGELNFMRRYNNQI